MNKLGRFIFLFSIFITFHIYNVKAQATYATEADLKKAAAKLFEDDEFEKAFPLYSQLASIYPKDPDYNYRIGVCMLYAMGDKEKPIHFLEYASTKPDVDKEVLYYLARAYHLNYRFDDAIAKYKEYKKVASSSKASKLQVDRQIEMCKNGKQLLRNLTDLVVTEKKEMSSEDFFRAYDVVSIGGKLLVKPEDKPFKTSLDKKKKESSVIYSAANNTQIYYSSYGDDASKGKDIYTIKRLPNGEWSSPQNLGAPVNTEYDEDFPFPHPNGKDLYFCSKGHNSMGGYDIFKTTYNPDTKTWSNAVNMDFPVNTPDDDILYVTDLNEKQAYFASNRSSTTGKIEVYHINVDRKPIDLALIEGKVIKNRDDEKLDLKIIVKDLKDNSTIGIYNSSGTDGSYTLKLPNGGKYLFTIESSQFATQSEVVVLPVQHEFAPMQQELSYELKKDKLVVKNLFEGSGDSDANFLLATNFIKEKAKMEVTAKEVAEAYANKQKEAMVESPKEVAPPPPSANKVTNEERLKVALKKAKDKETVWKDAQEQSDISLNYVRQKNEIARNEAQQAAQLLADAAKMDDNVKKQATIAKAKDINTQAQQKISETKAALNLSKKLSAVAEAKKQESEQTQQYVSDLEMAINSKTSSDDMKKLDEQMKSLDALEKSNTTTEVVFNTIKTDLENKKKELDKAVKSAGNKKQEIADNDAMVVTLKADLARARNEDLKKGLNEQITQLNEDNKGLEKELDKKNADVFKIQIECDGLKNENDLSAVVIEQANNGTSEEAAAKVADVNKVVLQEKVNDNARIIVENDNTINAANVANKQVTSTASTQAIVSTPQTTNTTKQPATATSQPETNTTQTIDNSTQPEVNKAIVSKENVATIHKKYQDEIAKTEKITDVLEREKAKAEVLKTWNKSIEENTAKQKEDLKSTTDAEQKKVLAKEIADAEKQSKELKTQTTESVAKVEALKRKNEVAGNTMANANKAKSDSSKQNNSSESLINNDKQVAGNTTSPATNAKQSTAVSIESINKKYQDEIALNNKKTNETERERTKLEILKAWNSDLEVNSIKQKEDLKQITDSEQKKTLAKQIADSENKTKELKTQTTETIAKVEALKKQNNAMAVNATAIKTDSAKQNTITAQVNDGSKQPIANITQPVVDKTIFSVDNISSINKKYKDEIEATNKITNELEREKAKSEVLKTWNHEVDEHIAKQKDDLEITTDTEQKKALTKAIADSEKKSKELKAETNESDTKVEMLKTESAVAVNSTNLNTKTETSENTKSTTVEKKSTEEKANKESTPGDNSEQPASTSIESINKKYQDELDATNSINNESEKEQAKAEVLKTWNKEVDENIVKQKEALNTTTDSEEKNLYAKKIADAEKQSKDLKTQTTQAVAKAEELKKKEGNVAVNTTAASTENTSQTNKDTKTDAIKSGNANQPTANVTSSNNKETKTDVAANKTSDATNTTVKNSTQPVTNPSQSVAVSLVSVNEKYTKQLKSTDKIEDKVERQKAQTEIYKTWNKEIDNNIAKQKEDLKTITDPNEKDLYAKIIADAEKLSKEIESQTKKSVAKTEILKKEPAIANNSTTTNPASTNQNTSNTNQPITAAANPDKKSATANKTTTNGYEPNEVFEKRAEAAYSAKKPIPLDVNCEKGLIFKVQIGAFTKPIPQDLFEGIRPITGESTKEGYTRYMAGLFVKFQSAQKAMDEIKSYGYKDAFVVAFLDGKRIPISQAFAMIGYDPSAPANTQTNVVTNNQPNIVNNSPNIVNNTPPIANNTPNNANNTSNIVNNTSPIVNNMPPIVNNVPPNANNTPNNANNTKPITTNQPATNTANKELVSGNTVTYTVQIGVFSQPLAPAKLNAIQPVFTETTPNGYIRYNSGNFATANQAAKAKNAMIESGFKDAFVTAYSNGKRISMAEARNLENPNVAVASVQNIPSDANPNTTNQKSPTIVEMVKDNNAKTATTTQPVVTNNNVPTTNAVQPAVAENKAVQPTTTTTQANVVNSTVQPTTTTQPTDINKEAVDTTTDEVPESLTMLTTTIQQLSNNNQPVVNTDVQPVVKNEHPAKANIQPVNTNQLLPANVAEQPIITQPIEPLPDSTKQKLVAAIAKYNELPADSGVVFKVQIGVFKEEIPLDVANNFLKVAKHQGIKNYKDESGNTVYIVGSYKSMDEAGKIKTDIVEQQIKDAFVVAFNGGRKISLEEANKIINK